MGKSTLTKSDQPIGEKPATQQDCGSVLTGRQDLLVLGIESSCDETACAVVRRQREVLSNLVHSQVALHAPYGGVVPEVAGRSHMERILPLVEQALQEASVTAADLDAIAVTHRPGLIGCLLVGLSVAKSLSLALDIPLIGLDHLQAHVHAAFMTEPDLPLPLLALVASGGHTTLFEVREPGKAVNRITLPGAVFVATIAILPYLLLIAADINSFGFAGTSVLISVGVALELMRQIDSQLTLRNYEGFLK